VGREVSLGQKIVVQVAVCGTRGITGSEDCSAGSGLWDERYHWVRGL